MKQYDDIKPIEYWTKPMKLKKKLLKKNKKGPKNSKKIKVIKKLLGPLTFKTHSHAACRTTQYEVNKLICYGPKPIEPKKKLTLVKNY